MGRRAPKGRLPKRIKNPDKCEYLVWGTEIRGRGEKVRKAYMKNRLSKGKPKEFYLSDYYEDPMTYPKDLPINTVYRVYDRTKKDFVRSKNSMIYNSLNAVKTFINKQPNPTDLEIVPCALLPLNPLPDKTLPALRKPDKSEPLTGYIQKGKERSIIKKKNEFNTRMEEIENITKELKENLSHIGIDPSGIQPDYSPDMNILPNENIESTEITENIENTEKKVLPKGYECHCGNEIKFNPWVYAHWYETVKHTCEECGKINLISEGRVV